jgi:hypothetical protein
MVFAVTLDKLRSDFKSSGIIVHFRYHRMVSKYMTKRNKPYIQVEDIQKAVDGVIKNRKKLR